MRPLCCDQPETPTQGYYPRVDSPVINAAPRRRVVTPLKYNYETDVVVGMSGAQRWAGGMVSFSLTTSSYFSVLLSGRSRDECAFLSLNHLALSVQTGDFSPHPGTHFLRPCL